MSSWLKEKLTSWRRAVADACLANTTTEEKVEAAFIAGFGLAAREAISYCKGSVTPLGMCRGLADNASALQRHLSDLFDECEREISRELAEHEMVRSATPPQVVVEVRPPPKLSRSERLVLLLVAMADPREAGKASEFGAELMEFLRK